MSQAPEEIPVSAEYGDLAPAYVQSIFKLNNMLDRGVSWSGSEANCCFLNTGKMRFANVSAISGLDFLDDGRALGLVDWDCDGDLDAWTSNRTAPMIRFVRNELPPGNRFLAIRLRGTKCNRDGINARVEVQLRNQPDVKLLKTLRAGEGFLGQSSKWLHFGLGKGSEVEKTIVHWPGGASEEVSGVAANGWYVIEQNTGRAERWHPPAQPELPPEPPLDATASANAPLRRTLLTTPLPLPSMEAPTYDGRRVPLTRGRKGPNLVNIWASWCQPCLVELQEFSERADDLRAVGLEVFALSVDQLGDDRKVDSERQQQILERLGYPFEAGPADAEIVGKIEVALNFVYGPDRAMSAPTSLLIDRSGRLVAVYKGKTTTDQILRDLQAVESGDEAMFQAAAPFAGRWVGPIPAARPLGFAAALCEADFNEDALDYVRDNSKAIVSDAGFAKFAAEMTGMLLADKMPDLALRHLRDAVKWAPEIAELQAQLGDLLMLQDHLAEADVCIQKALQLNPKHAAANLLRGNLLNRRRDLDGAAQHFERAIAARPDYAQAFYQLGAVRFQQGRTDEALRHMERFLELRPGDVNARVNLGAMLAMQRRPSQAEEQLRKALDLDPDNAMAHNNLGRVLQDQQKDVEAMEQFRLAMSSKGSELQGALNLAKLLATSKDPAVRNPVEAIALAEKWSAATGRRRPDVLQTLGFAYASAEQREKAIEVVDLALRLATTQGDRALAVKLAQQLADYRQTSDAQKAPSP